MVELRETYRGVAFPWLCDHMGHLNTARYVEMFDVATHHFFHQMGLPPVNAQFGLADVRQEIDYLAEAPMGALLLIRSGLLKVGGSSIRTRHVMTDPDGTITHAVLETVTVRLDMAARKSAPFPSEFASRAQQLMLSPDPPVAD